MRLFEQRKPKAIRHFPGKTAMVLAVLLLAHAFLFGPAAAEERPVKLMIVSDLHYLAPSLYEESDGGFSFAFDFGIIPGEYMRTVDMAGSASVQFDTLDAFIASLPKE